MLWVGVRCWAPSPLSPGAPQSIVLVRVPTAVPGVQRGQGVSPPAPPSRRVGSTVGRGGRGPQNGKFIPKK